jgi:hypothetical protein
VWTGEEMIVWGGRAGDCVGCDHLSSGGRYDPLSDSWETLPMQGAPSARRVHVAVWAGDQMIVWGGIDGPDVNGDGARYLPASDSWLAIDSQGAPVARALPRAAWSGSEMIVWGGYGGGGLDSGGRYAP